MLPPTAATSATTEETMPGRSPPWTVSTHDVPPVGRRCSSGTSRTVTVSVAVGGQRRQRGLDRRRRSASPAQTSIIAKWPRSRVIVESSRLRPEPGELAGGLGDDAGAVVAEDGDGVEGHALAFCQRRQLRRAPSTSSSMSSVSRPVKVFCWLGW